MLTENDKELIHRARMQHLRDQHEKTMLKLRILLGLEALAGLAIVIYSALRLMSRF